MVSMMKRPHTCRPTNCKSALKKLADVLLYLVRLADKLDIDLLNGSGGKDRT